MHQRIWTEHSGMDTNAAASQLTAWYVRNVKVIIAAVIGVAIGIAIKYPTGWELSDGVLGMVSALVQAAATGAAVILGIRLEARLKLKAEADLQRDLRSRLVRRLWPLFTDLELFFERVGDRRNWRKISRDVQDTATKHAEELHASRLFNEKLDISGFESLQVIESTIEAIAAMSKACAAYAEPGDFQDVEAKFEASAAQLHDTATGLLQYLGTFSSPGDVDKIRFQDPR